MKSAQEEDSLLVKRMVDQGMGGVLKKKLHSHLPSESDCTVRQAGFSLSSGIESYKFMFTSRKQGQSRSHMYVKNHFHVKD